MYALYGSGGGMKGALTGPQMVKLHPLGTNEAGGEKIGLVGNFKASGASIIF